jgi:protein-disulfide isomerase
VQISDFHVRVRRLYLLAVPLLVGAATVVWFQHSRPDSHCTPIGDSTLREISDYLSTRMRLPVGESVRVTRSGYLPGTCTQRLLAEAGEKAKPSVYFASEDGRYLFQQAMDLSHPAQRAIPQDAKAQPVDMSRLISKDRPSLGNAAAPVTIVEFSDFQCPFCKKLASTLTDQVLPSEKGKVRLIFRQFPLSIHQHARDEAELAACTGHQDSAAFWKLHDFLFARPKGSEDSTIREALTFLKAKTTVNAEAIQSCITDHTMTASIEEDIRLGREYGVTGTPSLFINGARVVGAQDQATYTQLIDRQAGSSPSPNTQAVSR